MMPRVNQNINVAVWSRQWSIFCHRWVVPPAAVNSSILLPQQRRNIYTYMETVDWIHVGFILKILKILQPINSQ